MTSTPRDLSDLYLAPIVLGIDARIEHLASLSPAEFILAVEIVADRPIDYRTLREEALLSAIVGLDDYHGWTFDWHPRGLRISHGDRSVVLGVPSTFTDYLTAPRLVIS